MLPEARIEFPEMQVPLMLDVGARRALTSSQFRPPAAAQGAAIGQGNQ
jgi:hypothetical protein